MKRVLHYGMVLFSAVAAAAATIEVNQGNELSFGWYTNGNSGGGASFISELAPRNGNGSLQLQGDRTRYNQGNPFLSGPATNLGLLSALTGFGMDWRVDTNTSLGLGADLSPALRLHIIDPGANNTLDTGDFRAELIWEFTYNGSLNTFGAWNSLDTNTSSGVFWRNVNQYVGGVGNTGVSFDSGGAQLFMTFSQWLAYALPIQASPGNAQPGFSPNAYIASISVGAGSTFGADYLGFADNIRLTFADQTIYNFESIPEPGTYAMMVAGLGVVVALRRRR
jgi:hypothetical protein